MPKLKIVEPLYNKSRNGSLTKVGYQINMVLTKANGEIIKSTVVKTKIYK